MIAEAVRKLRQRLDLPVDPSRRGPVPLDHFFENMTGPRVAHFARPDVSRRTVAEHLRSQGLAVGDLGESDDPLVGFLFLAGNAAWAYVCNDENNRLGRQRFTAAHELGHAVLHRDRMRGFVEDAAVSEGGDTADPMEAEANRFAAELLMPEEVIRARAEELKRELRMSICPRGVLEYRLAAELLVSGQAIRFRLSALGVGDD